MTRTAFALVMVAIAAVVLLAMWIGWRGRARRHSAFAEHGDALVGAVVAAFPRVGYVSTTRIGAPLDRLSIPGLQFKGFADVTLRADGATIAVTGEPEIHLPVDRLLGTDVASRRVGKAVERDGLSVLQWRAADGSAVESSFRFSLPADQLRFADAVAQIIPAGAAHAPGPQTHSTPHTTQEDA
ncbi:PH-like domain-containing protein [Leucobacter chromiiresistens]|uniref:PH domain-containing protein n=1 Tax=Leucobacter chromiiresistens TaxID=1079994 RepID=A0A1H1A318_9MICO|nr:hypothetical protein [Leucobacter chromiiresistens]SDQ34077.1 hypothetical protein SAMN04488565_2297 [Leucobacter chromiiresistens]